MRFCGLVSLATQLKIALASLTTDISLSGFVKAEKYGEVTVFNPAKKYYDVQIENLACFQKFKYETDEIANWQK